MPDENDPLKPKYTAREIVGIYKKISSDIFKVGLIGKIKNPFSLFRPNMTLKN
jgi:hypothetical protein